MSCFTEEELLQNGISPEDFKPGWGPFEPPFMGYEGEAESLEKKYPVPDGSVTGARPTVFYGASNFRMWKNMDKDLAQFRAQNHGFGGATDVLLAHYAPRLLFPYSPDITVLQTGSNDCGGMSGGTVKKVGTCLTLKKMMLEWFLEQLPDTKILVLSGLLLPGLPGGTKITQRVNEGLKEICSGNDRLFFADASDMTFDGKDYRAELFKSDGIHLNRDGQLLWCGQYIKPALEVILEQDHLKV